MNWQVDVCLWNEKGINSCRQTLEWRENVLLCQILGCVCNQWMLNKELGSVFLYLKKPVQSGTVGIKWGKKKTFYQFLWISQ